MNIGNQYKDSKLYRGIKYSNGLPLLMEDLTEFSDTIASKSSFLLSSILGSGLINEIDIYYNPTGIGISNPAVLNIEGDICLIKNSQNRYLTTMADIRKANQKSGLICVVGWYQHITSQTTMKEYGGVNNLELENDLIYKPLGIQVTTRYQFRWDTCIIPADTLGVSTNITIPARDRNGVPRNSQITITDLSSLDSIYTAVAPKSMDYAVDSKIYIIPLMKYTINEDSQSLQSIESVDTRKTEGSQESTFIKTTEEPVGIFSEGTTWYNPETNEFRIYVQGIGFVPTSSKVGILRYQYVNIASSNIEKSQDISYKLDFSNIYQDDIIDVSYEGLALKEGADYSLDRESKQLKLLNFTRVSGERLIVNLTRLVKTTNAKDFIGEFNQHTNLVSNNILSGHVRLSDDISEELDSSSGVAVTPKAVISAIRIKDESSENIYQFIVSNNNLYIENISTKERKLVVSNII